MSGARRAFLLAGAILVAGPAGVRAAGSGSRGTAAATFLTMDAGSRASAMGGAQVAAADDATALFWNPAGLTQIPSLSVVLSHVPYIAGTSYGNVAYGSNWNGFGAVGLGLQYASAGSSDRTDEAGVTVGTVSPRDNAASLGYAYRLHDLDGLDFLNGYSFGVSVKHVSSRIIDGAEAVTGGAGLLSREYFQRRFRWGVAVSNEGGKLKYGSASEDLPREARAGVSLRLARGWSLTADAILPGDDKPAAAAGAEYAVDLGPRLKVAARAGYTTRWDNGRDGLSGLTAGFGMVTRLVSVDYFARFQGNGWLAQGVSLSWGFGARDGLPPEARDLLAEARRMMAQNRFAEAVLKYNQVLQLAPSCREAEDGVEEAARQLK